MLRLVDVVGQQWTTLLIFVFLFVQHTNSLYSVDDHIYILDSNNITDFIVNQHQDERAVQLIQFYNSYCGHCIHFAPTFKDFVKNIIQWKQLIHIGVLDCSKEINAKSCNNYHVNGFPTLRTFWFKPKSTDIGEDFHASKESVETLRDGLLKWLTDKSKQTKLPSGWPLLTPLVADNRTNLIQMLNLDDNVPVVIVVENDKSYLGREILMDFAAYQDKVKLFRMVESNIRLIDQLSPNVFDKFHTPFLLTVDNNKEFKVVPEALLTKDDHRQQFKKFLIKEFVNNFEDLSSTTLVLASDRLSQDSGLVRKYSEHVYVSDLYNSIRYSLFHEILLKKQLNLEQTNALIHFLNVLSENFPFQDDKSKQFIKHLHDFLVKKVNSTKRKQNLNEYSIDTEDIRTTMNMYEEYYHFPEMGKYYSCADVSPLIKRSYPCSLWTLFHVMTVAEYQRSLLSKQWSSLHATLYAMRDYIKNFFGCTECAQHFTEMSTNLENELTYSNSSVLWLWHAHNKVNARLKGSSSESKLLPKRQFPTYDECANCYISKPDVQFYSNYESYQRYFNEKQILQFLVNYYSASKLIVDTNFDLKQPSATDNSIHLKSLAGNGGGGGALISKLSYESVGKTNSSKSNQIFSLFTHFDYSLIFVFYLISLVMLFSLYIYLKSSRNRKTRKYFV